MISLIICSRKTDINQDLKDNIAATIGVDYELVVIDNSAGQYSIFQAYNIGVERSSYPILCFMHDDILYHTANWGQRVIEHFSESSTGAIGIAGSPYAPKMPGSWWGGGLVYQSLVPEGEDTSKVCSADGCSYITKEVVMLDGIWLCIKKELFRNIRFDEEHFSGYHVYDLDICLQVARTGAKLFAISDVWISHHSKGDVNQSWITNTGIFNKKWAKYLPMSVGKIAYNQKCEAENRTLREYLNIMLSNYSSVKQTYKIGLKHLLFDYRLYFYYKTPLNFFRFLNKYLTA